jgi:hypothetical protein
MYENANPARRAASAERGNIDQAATNIINSASSIKSSATPDSDVTWGKPAVQLVYSDQCPRVSGVAFLKEIFGATTEQVYLCSFPNGDDPKQAGPRHVVTRQPSVVTRFLKTWDKRGRGLFFCVGTIAGTTRNKAAIVETVGLHADIDFKDIDGDVDRDEIVRKLLALLHPPTVIVFSGGGLHCYWLFKEALPTQGNIGRIETALRQLADLVAGDPAVCEVARVLRLPTSHNTKDGKWTEVEVIRFQTRCRYELDDLEEWLAEARPILSRKQRGPADQAPVTDCPFIEYARQFGMQRVDVDERLQQMTYKGVEDSSIHRTQLACTAAMLNRGMPVDEVVGTVLAHTAIAAGVYASGWDWKHEQHKLRRMCDRWIVKRRHN